MAWAFAIVSISFLGPLAFAAGNRSSLRPDQMIQALAIIEAAGTQMVEWEWVVARSTLNKQPRWHVASGEPPLGLHKAIALVMKDIKSSRPNISGWRLEPITLKSLRNSQAKEELWLDQVWCYHIQLVPENADEYDLFEKRGELGTLSRIVLMDGTILAPTMKKQNNPDP